MVASTHHPHEPIYINNVEDETAELNRKIGARLRYARKARGMTQAALGGMVGVSFQQIRKYEMGENRISTAVLIQVARVLEISPLDLLGVEAPGGETLPEAEGAEMLLRAYKAIGSPKLRRIVLELARSLTRGD